MYRWDRQGGSPDFSSGPSAGLKCSVIKAGVASLIAQEGLEPDSVGIWMDYFCIDQLDPVQKAMGVESMLAYTTKCRYMLIPLSSANTLLPDGESYAYYPEDLPGYGERGWCRIEFFIFSLFNMMQQQSTVLQLYACGTDSELQHFKSVEFSGGDRGDLASQGEFTEESDRAAIAALERRMISLWGHSAIELAVAEDDRSVDLGAQMLLDEHWSTLEDTMDNGDLSNTTRLSLNSNCFITTFPPLRNTPKLATLSFTGCTSLVSLPDLSSLLSLRVIKLDGCNRLEALPALPETLEIEMCCFPEHLQPY